jgi:hypothetical protein
MSDVTRRLSRWQAKYSPDLAAQTTARIYADMSERYQASLIALCSMESETKQVLDSSGIDTMYIVFYLDFAPATPSPLAWSYHLGSDPGEGSAGALG